ncbi:MAG: VOC family protein [Litorilinea sp.]
MMKLNPYIFLPGTATEAIELYKEVFNVEPTGLMHYSDMPGDAAAQDPDMAPSTETAAARIMHASFEIGADTLMISDAPEGQDNTVVMGGQTILSAHPDSREEADRIFALLSDGGTVQSPMNDEFWGDYFGQCIDRFGVIWMVNYNADTNQQ